MGIRDIYNKLPVQTIDDRDWKFTFGRYAGNTLEFVLATDPQYILYCQNNIDWLDFDYDIIEEAEGHRDDGFNQLLTGFGHSTD